MTALPILTYHSLDDSGSVVSLAPRTFAEQMDCLADLGVRALALRDAVAHRDATGVWPARAVVLTFDDGYANFADAALPVLMRYGFGATLFLVSGHVGRRNDWARPPARLGTQAMVSWSQASAAAAAGIEIGCHTRSHCDLRRLDAGQAADEIAAARADIEQHVQAAVESFAYPYGTRAWQSLVQREFRAACTMVLKRAAQEPAHRLPRIDMYYIPTAQQLRALLAGHLDAWLRLRRCGRSVRGLLSAPVCGSGRG